MNPEKWNEVKEIFNAAVELPPDARAGFLDGKTGGDAELRQAVEKLLASDENAETLFEGLPVFAPQEFSANDRIGNYRIIKKIGEGGMGAVYLAERADLKQKVALKIIRRGADSEIILKRFRREQEILAALEHPNIARLLDVGASADGVPFLAMEYVEGEDLTAFSHRRDLSVSDKLVLFRKICEAVAYAHSRLVVHRDLKPSNIIVNEQGEPKLLDFGISKLLSETESAEEKGTVTALGMLTPNYASPEQFRGETVSTATDVYSLGVVLFELLTDALPYEITGKRPDEVARAVMETNPQKPSEVVNQSQVSGSKPPPTAENDWRRTTDNEANRKSRFRNLKSLRGDLDNIILKSLRKEPARRYSSVERFSDDLRRHLSGLPVTARADTFSYRAEKFIKRNRTAVLAGLIVFLTLIGGIAATSWQAVRAERQRVLAQRRFDDVKSLANNVVFKYHDEIANLEGATKAREILISDAIEYVDRLSQDAADDVSLKYELGKFYQRIGELQGKGYAANSGDTAGAIKNYEKSIALLEEAAAKLPDIQVKKDLRVVYDDFAGLLLRAGDERRGEYARKSLTLAERLLELEQTDQTRLALADSLLTVAGSGSSLTNVAPGNQLNSNEIVAAYEKSLNLAQTVLQTAPDNSTALRTVLAAGQRLSTHYSLVAQTAAQAADQERSQKLWAECEKYENIQLETARKMVAAQPDNAVNRRNLFAIEWNQTLRVRDMGDVARAAALQEPIVRQMKSAVIADAENSEAKYDLILVEEEFSLTLAQLKQFDRAMNYINDALAISNQLLEQDANNLEYWQARRDVVYDAGAIWNMRGDTEEAVKIFRSGFEQYKKAPMLKDDETALLFDEGLMLEKIGDAYKEAAGKNAGNRQTRLESARAAYRKSLELWQNPDVMAENFSDGSDQLDTLRKKLAECEQPAA